MQCDIRDLTNVEIIRGHIRTFILTDFHISVTKHMSSNVSRQLDMGHLKKSSQFSNEASIKGK